MTDYGPYQGFVVVLDMACLADELIVPAHEHVRVTERALPLHVLVRLWMGGWVGGWVSGWWESNCHRVAEPVTVRLFTRVIALVQHRVMKLPLKSVTSKTVTGPNTPTVYLAQLGRVLDADLELEGVPVEREDLRHEDEHLGDEVVGQVRVPV